MGGCVGGTGRTQGWRGRFQPPEALRCSPGPVEVRVAVDIPSVSLRPRGWMGRWRVGSRVGVARTECASILRSHVGVSPVTESIHSLSDWKQSGDRQRIISSITCGCIPEVK